MDRAAIAAPQPQQPWLQFPVFSFTIYVCTYVGGQILAEPRNSARKNIYNDILYKETFYVYIFIYSMCFFTVYTVVIDLCVCVFMCTQAPQSPV